MNWINVKDGLPELGEYVLVLFENSEKRRGRGMCVLELTIINFVTYWENYDGNESFSFDQVTHWMPLPGPPND